MKHTLVIIGWIGVKRAYLDVSNEEAVRRYVLSELGYLVDPRIHADAIAHYLANPDLVGSITMFEFDDEFCVYDAWA